MITLSTRRLSFSLEGSRGDDCLMDPPIESSGPRCHCSFGNGCSQLASELVLLLDRCPSLLCSRSTAQVLRNVAVLKQSRHKHNHTDGTTGVRLLSKTGPDNYVEKLFSSICQLRPISDPSQHKPARGSTSLRKSCCRVLQLIRVAVRFITRAQNLLQ